MMLPQFSDNPFQVKLAFHKMIERFEEIAASDTNYQNAYAKDLLQKTGQHPELKDGITNAAQIEDNAGLIAQLLAELFPSALTKNEIKAVSIPYQGLVFNYSERFRDILKDAGPAFEANIRDFDDHKFYVISCCLILNTFYGTHFDFSKPFFYDIPTADGIVKHYRILYNADFLEITPTERSPKLSPDDINLLIDNYDDLALWKAKFPPGSYIMKGFAIMNLFDATIENAVSILKGNLLGNAAVPDLQKSFELIFRSIFRIPDIRMGFTLFDKSEDKFSSKPFGKKVQSFLLPDKWDDECKKILCGDSYDHLIKEHTYFAVSNVSEFVALNPDNEMAEHFQSQNIQSFILAPAVKDGVLLGVLELVSPRVKDLNSINANKLEIVMPFLVDAIDRKINDLQNQIQAVIQDNYTTLHPSVDWKFKHEAKNYIKNFNSGLTYTLKEIVFKDVYPLYGQVDIKDSSITRNLSVKNDLENQLNQLIAIIEQLHKLQLIAKAEQSLLNLRAFISELDINVNADTEQRILHYLETKIYPLFKPAHTYSKPIEESIKHYFEQTHAITGDFYSNRRNYEKTLALVNEKLAGILDERQAEIQSHFPHYYERFKTDGVEHNLYIGSSIAPNRHFELTDLHRLRLWQLRVIAEMEIEQYHLQTILPYHLGVTSLILVFNNPISIRFRMDEKHFDIDGAYNIRYEVIKKRIDKAFIKNTNKRITYQGKITIIYTNSEEEEEYRRYIHILQSTGILADEIEQFDVEDLQGVSGLKALRIGVLHAKQPKTGNPHLYEELYHQLQKDSLNNLKLV